MSRSEQGLAALSQTIDHFKGIREDLARSTRVEAVSPDGSITVVADAERPYSISIDTDRAASLDPNAVESAVLHTHNQAHRRLHEQILHALPARMSGARTEETAE
jgi:DNA-binding protein YbaB